MCYTKYILMSILCLVTQYGWAQDEKPYFEGEIMRTSMVNGRGGEYKGKHIERFVYKNGSRHIYDTRLCRHIIQLYDQNRCIVYYDGQDKAAEYPLDKLYALGRSASAWGATKKFEFHKTDETVVIQGYTCDIYEGTQEVDQNFKVGILSLPTDRQTLTTIGYRYAVCPNWRTDSIWQKFGDNDHFPVEGMVMKMVSDLKVTDRVKFSRVHSNLYQSEVVTKIEERPVDDKEFELPAGVTVQKFRTFFSAGTLLSEMEATNRKMLKKEKRYPTQLPDNDTFDTDDDWED